MTPIESLLADLGLNDKEIAVYLLLLRNGTSPASVLGQRAGITRSTAHYTCQQLAKKGIVTKVLKDNAFLFSPEPPEKLAYLIQQQKQKLDQKENRLRSMMGELQAMVNPHSALPKMTVFEGVDSVLQAVHGVVREMEEDSELLIFALPVHFDMAHARKDREADAKKLLEVFVRDRLRKRIAVRMIALRSPRAEEVRRRDALELRETRIVDSVAVMGAPVEILVYHDKIFSLSVEHSVLFATLVQSAGMAALHKTMFELAWAEAGRRTQSREPADAA